MPSNSETLLRQWQMLRSIPRYPAKITAASLKEKLDAEGYRVAKRTVERDLQELSLAFPLMLDNRSKPYGWSWQKDAPAFDLPGLGNNEALTLTLVEQHLQQLMPASTLDVLAPYFKAAHQHLASLPKAKHMLGWPDKVRSVVPMQPLLPPRIIPEIQRIISEALLSDRQLQISYRPRGKKSAKYRIHPLALVQRGPLLYLYVRMFDYEDTRILALHRITLAEMLPETTQYPPNFNLDNEIAQGRFSFGDGTRIQLKAKFDGDSGVHLYETPLSQDQVIEELPEGMFITATVADTPQLAWWLLALGASVEVLEPTSLREKIAHTVREMGDIYRS